MPNDYSKRLKDPRWQRKRLEVMERDNFTCRDTGATDEPLNVHHCWYAKGGPWETPSEYLLTLTEEAHRERQELEGRAKRALGKHFAKMEVCELESLVKSLEASDHMMVACSPYDVCDFLAAIKRLGYSDSEGVGHTMSELFEDFVTTSPDNREDAMRKAFKYWHDEWIAYEKRRNARAE